MTCPNSFLRREDGAVTADYVVLLAVAAAMAVATATILSDTAWTWINVSRTGAVDAGNVSGTGTAITGYLAHNPLLHSALVEDFEVLTDDELDTVEAFVNRYISEWRTEIAADEEMAANESNSGVLTDLNFALAHAYTTRKRKRPNGKEFDEAEVGRLALKMGWDSSMGGMYGEQEDG